MLTFFVLFLGICVVESKARDSANIWGGSRVLLVTDLPNATVNVDKLYTSLADRGLADVFNRLVIIQRGHDGHFIKSHGSFRALSRVQDRTLWSISKKETLPWLLKEEANVIICVADSKADVPRILISAQRKGMFPPDIKLMIWMIQDDVMAADGMNMISLISPGDFDPQSSSLDDDPSFALGKVHSIFARNLESAAIELLQVAKDDDHHRERRNLHRSLSQSYASMSSSMTTKVLSSNPAAAQSLSSSMTTKAPNSSPMFGQSMLSSMPTKVSISSSSSAVSQSVSSSLTDKVSTPSSSSAISQSVSSSMPTKVSIPSSSSAVSQSVSNSLIAKVSIPSSSSAVSQSVSSSMTPKVAIPSSSSASQSVSSSMPTKVSIPSLSSAVRQSVSSSMTPKVAIPSSSSASQSVSSSMPTKVSIPSSSSAVSQSVSSSLIAKVSIPSSSSAVSQSVSSSMTPKVAIPSSSSASQSVSSSMPTKVSIPSLSSAVRQSVSSSMTPKVAIPSSSSASQSVSSSMPTKVSIPSSSSAVSQSVSSSLIAKVSIPSSSSAVSQSVSSSMTTKVSILSSISAVSQSVSSSMTPKVAIPSSSPAAGKSMSSFLTSQVVAQRSSAATAPVVTTAPVVSSPVGLSTSVPVTTKVTAPTAATHTVSPFISSSVAVMPTESAASTVSKSRSTPMVVSSFTVTQSTSVAVPIKSSSLVTSLPISSIPLLSSSVPSESLEPPSTSSQKSLVATALQRTISLSSPVISTPFHSMKTSSTPQRVLSSSVTPGSTSLPTTAIIVATSTRREPPSSSSRAVVTQQPVYENETIVIEFDGNCNHVVGNVDRENKFEQEFVSEVAGKLDIPEKAIAVTDIACGSIRVTFTLITGTSGKANVSHVLKKLVDNGNISVTVDNKTYRASNLEVVRPTTPSTLAPTTEGKKNEIAFILYITFGALMACIFIVGFVVLVVRCRRDRQEGSFHLNSHTSYELGRFHGIPRANTSYDRVDFYGEPVEMDAAVANPEVDDEFQAEGGVYPYDVSPTGGRAAASNCSVVKEEKFNVDAMGMPEWKNLPKLSAKEITVAESSEDIPKSSGSVGSRHLLMDDEPKDSGHAYDNPVLTFGDGPTGLDKEDS